MERRPWMGVNQLLPVEQRQDGALEQPDDVQLRQQHEGDGHADDDRPCHPEEPFAKLLQMIQERHLMARSVAHARPRCCYLIDCRRSSARAASSERGKRLMISWNNR